MLSQVNGSPTSLAMSGKKPDAPTGKGRNWLYEEGPKEQPSEDDDFEGNRNWAVILVLLALALLPIGGLVMLLL